MHVDPPMDPALVERLAAGIAQAEEGHAVDLGDFSPYLDDADRDGLSD